eukprot:4340354-Pleurochrysis_carterae.AAC.1
MAEKVAEEGVPFGSNTTGCSLSLAGTSGNFKKARASIDEAVKNAEVHDVCVISLPRSVGVEVKTIVASNALCELVLLIPLVPASRRESKCGIEMVLPASTRVMFSWSRGS